MLTEGHRSSSRLRPSTRRIQVHMWGRPRSSATEKHSPCGTLNTWSKERDMKLKYRTVVFKVPSRLPRRDSVSHSGVEDLS